MLCACEPPERGGAVPACGPACLNRTLNVECVGGYCPAGGACTNQAFTKKQHAALAVERAGAKGHGLFAAEGLPAGAFVTEYVGEVLEEAEYARRRAFYADAGQRHYYFMTLGNGEVIDACRKGGPGRFVNHSCAANCETQKWTVRGELAVGLFTTRPVSKGEELTFDYNFERYGDKPLRCLCATAACSGYIGGGAVDEATRAAWAAEDEAEDAVAEAADAADDPEPIQVTARDGGVGDNGIDPALVAIMAAQVGLAAGENPLGSRKKPARAPALKARSDDEDYDADGDGYGAPGSTTIGCAAPLGYAGTSDDCNDSDDAVNPAATETLDLVDQDCDTLVDENFRAAGDIVVTEVARQPYKGGSGRSTNGNAQWFEVYNPGTAPIDMSGWYIEDQVGDFFYIDPDAALVVPAGGYAVLCYDDVAFSSPSQCDYTWGDSALGVNQYGLPQFDTTYYFDRDEDLVALYVDGNLIDQVAWNLLPGTGGAIWPRTARYSMRLDDNALDSVSNDQTSRWCLSPTVAYVTYTAGGLTLSDYGSPGAANGSCD